MPAAVGVVVGGPPSGVVVQPGPIGPSSPAVPIESAQPAVPADPAANAKTMLNNFVQRQLRGVVTRADITYSVQQFGSQYQATVALNSMSGGKQFAGALAANVKDAEQSAAEMALDHHAAQIAAQSAEPRNKKKTKSEGGGPPANQRGLNKMLLNTAVSRILRRPLKKDDISFTSRAVPGGWQATLAIPVLPDHWSGLAWAGDVDSSQKEAEDLAAVHAIRALEADDAMGSTIATKKKAPPEALSEAVPVGVVIGSNRTSLSENRFTGVVEDWRSWGFGWVSIDSKVDHPAAEKNDGQVYLIDKEWAHEAPPQKGQAVTFLLYADSIGLGAEACKSVA